MRQTALLRSPKHSKPEVDIKPCAQTGYWVINIMCKDRNKLLFDTVSGTACPNRQVFSKILCTCREQI